MTGSGQEDVLAAGIGAQSTQRVGTRLDSTRRGRGKGRGRSRGCVRARARAQVGARRRQSSAAKF